VHFDEIQARQGFCEPTTQHQQNSSVDSRPGASILFESEDALTPSGELPMIVWLRGDEPWAGEFTLSADEVMKDLDIKRSRLTQISGHELRVGRMRVDRYVRPVYRPEDVEAYKAWTRSTATHQRASNIIQEAAETLEKQSAEISKELQSTLRASSEEITSQLSRHEAKIAAIQSELIRFLREDMAELRLEMVDTGERRHASIRDRLERVDGALLPVADLAQKIQHLSDLLAEVSQSTQQTMLGMRVLRESQQNFARDVGKALGLILDYQKEAFPRWSQSLTREIRAMAAPEGSPRLATSSVEARWSARQARRRRGLKSR
jgi:hypothetical protein